MKKGIHKSVGNKQKSKNKERKTRKKKNCREKI